MMRTTLNLPDDVYEAARSIADARRISIGEELAELVRRGLKPSAKVNTKTPFPCFNVSPKAKPITLQQTLAAEDDV